MTATERLVHLTDAEIESLLDPWRETRALDLDDQSYAALRKLQDAQGGGLDEELAEPERHGPIPRTPQIGESASQWFVELMLEQEPLPDADEENFQRFVVQHCQNAMSRLAESTRHAHEGNKERVIKDAAVLGLFALHIARRAVESSEWPIRAES